MPIFEKPPLDTLATAKDRWTPLYLEHGRLEVDDSSVKWIAKDGSVVRIPVATVSALVLGPGTSLTHAAVKACADCNTPLFWTRNWDTADGINRALSAANASLYALTAAVVCSMGFLPQLGFVHDAGTLPFIYDVADLYKHETSWPAAFEAISVDPRDDGRLARKKLKERIESTRLLKRMPEDLKLLVASPKDAA